MPDDDTAVDHPSGGTAGPPGASPVDAPARTPAGPGTSPADAAAAARPPLPDRPLLPDVTADERDVGWGDSYEQDDDERFLREVPPHHGG